MKARSKLTALLTTPQTAFWGPPAQAVPSLTLQTHLRPGPALSPPVLCGEGRWAHRRLPPHTAGPPHPARPHLCPAAARCKLHNIESQPLKNNTGLLLQQDVLTLEAPAVQHLGDIVGHPGSRSLLHRPQHFGLHFHLPLHFPRSRKVAATTSGLTALCSPSKTGRTLTPRAPPVSNETVPEAPADAPRT